MRLLIVSQYFWPENFRVNDLVAELGRRGHAVTVLTGLPNYPEGIVPPEYRREPVRFGNDEGAEVVRVPLVPRGKGGLLILNYASFAMGARGLEYSRQEFDRERLLTQMEGWRRTLASGSTLASAR